MKKTYLCIFVFLFASNAKAADWDALSLDGQTCYERSEITKKILKKRYGFSKEESKQILKGTFESDKVTYYTHTIQVLTHNKAHKRHQKNKPTQQLNPHAPLLCKFE